MTDNYNLTLFICYFNSGCGKGEVKIFETLQAKRNPRTLCNEDTQRLLKILCRRNEDEELTVIAVNVKSQKESECGCLR